MKMFVDASGNVGLKPDPKPKIKHDIVGKGILGSIIAAIAKLVVTATGTNIEISLRVWPTSFRRLTCQPRSRWPRQAPASS